MKTKLFIFFLILVVALEACSPSKPRSLLADNREKWQAKNVRHYRFDLSIGCFCPFHEQMPLSIEVLNGEVISLTAKNGEDVTPFLESYRRSDTIDKLFAIIASAEDRADEIKIEYDPSYGFPTSAWIYYMKNAADDEMGYVVTNFEVLE